MKKDTVTTQRSGWVQIIFHHDLHLIRKYYSNELALFDFGNTSDLSMDFVFRLQLNFLCFLFRYTALYTIRLFSDE